MVGWNRQGLDFYRDRFLAPPVLLFKVLSIANILVPESPGDRLQGLKLAACALVAVFLAKDRRKVILVGGLVWSACNNGRSRYEARLESVWSGILIEAGTMVALLLTVRT